MEEDSMKIAIRTDASLKIGIGHVMRCLTLAEELRRRNGHVQFVCRKHPGHLADKISKKGFAVTLLPSPVEAVETVLEKDDYAAWLGVSQKDDAVQTIAALGAKQIDWLIVDHYGLDHEWETTLRPHTRKIMVIDDIANRKHDCDLLLDQNFSQELEVRYNGLAPKHCKILLGPRYALLKPEYAEYRKIQTPRNGKINKILIFMGGSDNANITGKVLELLSTPELTHIEVDVVLGENNPHQNKILHQSKNCSNTNVYNARPHLADLMARADLAIGAGGVTTWERMCLGLPSLVISIADNQKPACQALSDAGFINYVGNWQDFDQFDLKERIISLLEMEDFLRFQSIASKAMVDGRGAERVIESLVPSNKKDFRLRPAREEDVYIYYDWVNDPVVRANALNSEHVSLATHLDWFDKTLSYPDTYMFVLEVKGLPVGQVRFELREDEAIIDYSLDQLVRGRGWGSELVRLGAQMLDINRPFVIQARVKPENKPSSAVFMRLGFDEEPLSRGRGVRIFRLQCSRIVKAGLKLDCHKGLDNT
jgi:UDP-2,4-diacetamido-2,4,6-trideoxy-beta-L-altropyranose hydrolase